MTLTLPVDSPVHQGLTFTDALPKVVGLGSPVPLCGKSTAAKHLVDRYGYMVLPFAGPLKALVIEFLVLYGYDPEDAYRLVYFDKQVPLELIPGRPTSRHLQQTLGTEWGRSCVHPDVWVNLWKKDAEEALALGQPIVCDDLRRANEVEALRSVGGVILRISRDQAIRDADPETLEHVSEGLFADGSHQEGACTGDYQILNNASVEGLHHALGVALESLGRRGRGVMSPALSTAAS